MLCFPPFMPSTRPSLSSWTTPYVQERVLKAAEALGRSPVNLLYSTEGAPPVLSPDGRRFLVLLPDRGYLCPFDSLTPYSIPATSFQKRLEQGGKVLLRRYRKEPISLEQFTSPPYLGFTPRGLLVVAPPRAVLVDWRGKQTEEFQIPVPQPLRFTTHTQTSRALWGFGVQYLKKDRPRLHVWKMDFDGAVERYEMPLPVPGDVLPTLLLPVVQEDREGWMLFLLRMTRHDPWAWDPYLLFSPQPGREPTLYSLPRPHPYLPPVMGDGVLLYPHLPETGRPVFRRISPEQVPPLAEEDSLQFTLLEMTPEGLRRRTFVAPEDTPLDMLTHPGVIAPLEWGREQEALTLRFARRSLMEVRLDFPRHQMVWTQRPFGPKGQERKGEARLDVLVDEMMDTAGSG